MKPDRSKLDAAMPSILSASKNNAVITQLCFRPGYSKRTFVEKLSLTSEHGVEGCRWSHMPWLKKEDGSGDPSIQVSILQKRVLDLVYKPGGKYVAKDMWLAGGVPMLLKTLYVAGLTCLG